MAGGDGAGAGRGLGAAVGVGGGVVVVVVSDMAHAGSSTAAAAPRRGRPGSTVPGPNSAGGGPVATTIGRPTGSPSSVGEYAVVVGGAAMWTWGATGTVGNGVPSASLGSAAAAAVSEPICDISATVATPETPPRPHFVRRARLRRFGAVRKCTRPLVGTARAAAPYCS